MSRFRFLNHMTREEVKTFAPDATLILPTAATEQHGPHLPMVTDTLIAGAIAEGAGREAGRDVPVCVGPVVAFGNSHHHLVYSALSLRTATFQAVLSDLLDSMVLAGFRRIFILNAHGGNDECIKLAVRDLVLRSDVTAAASSYWSIAHEAVAREWGGEPYPGHAGTFETSLMMALAPELVRTDLSPKDERHPVAVGNSRLFAGVIVRHGEWRRIDGYSDAPLNASREKGEALLRAITQEVARAVLSLHRLVPDEREREHQP
jgi:creatinine amidohydrolase